MAGKIQRKHPQAPAVNQTLLTSLENFIETAKNSNHKLTSLLLIDKRKDKTWPFGSSYIYQRTHNTDYIKKFKGQNYLQQSDGSLIKFF